jgi:hypothetical protein
MSRPPNRSILFTVLLLALLTISSKSPSTIAVEAPPFMFPLAAPWPAGVVLHAGGDGYGYGPGKTHKGTDLFALDFNGWPNENDPPVETNDKDLLVLAVADGCVKKVEYSNSGYGWNVVISHAVGYESRYAHLKDAPLLPLMSYNPNACYFVSQGQPLGQIGGTGTVDNAVHLHFAMYYCDKSGTKCNILPVQPEPLDGFALSDSSKQAVKVTSQNYSVGYEAITGTALTNPASLILHQSILDEYRVWGGQVGFFGRAVGPVSQITGTNIFYQEFQPHALMCTFDTAIVEVESRAYMLPRPTWDLYQNNRSTYGNPNASTYVAQMEDGETGWRTDFQNVSLFWDQGLTTPVVWDNNNAPWKALFCPGTNNYSCNPVRRRDPYIDFSFSDSNNPGPLHNSQGFSALWQASFNENDVSKISLEYEIQGHARFYIDENIQGDWINSEDGIIQGITKPSWHVGGNTFKIRFWQSPGKPAYIRLKIHETGLSIIPKVEAAFDSQEVTLASSGFQPTEAEYVDFEPPPYPGDPGAEPGLPEIPTTPTPSPSPIPSFDIGKWWDNLVNKIKQQLEQWWQNLSEEIQKRIEEELAKKLNELLAYIEQQCLGTYALGLTLGVGVILRNRRRRQ